MWHRWGWGVGTLIAKLPLHRLVLEVTLLGPPTCLIAFQYQPQHPPSLLDEDRPNSQKSEGLWITVVSNVRLQLVEGITGNLGGATSTEAILSGGNVHLRPWTCSSQRRRGNRWPFIHRGQAQPHARSHLAQAPASGAQLNAHIKGRDHKLL